MSVSEPTPEESSPLYYDLHDPHSVSNQSANDDRVQLIPVEDATAGRGFHDVVTPVTLLWLVVYVGPLILFAMLGVVSLAMLESSSQTPLINLPPSTWKALAALGFAGSAVCTGILLVDPNRSLRKYYKRRLLRFFEERPDRLFDPRAETCFHVELTPRSHWQQMTLVDTAIDHGFIWMDECNGLLLYEGDSWRAVIAADAIQSLSVDYVPNCFAYATVLRAEFENHEEAAGIEFCFLFEQTIGLLTTRRAKRKARMLGEAIATLRPGLEVEIASRAAPK
ncbi:MAG: hypothetical protein AAF593_14625 [Planctomycetota bacterium]